MPKQGRDKVKANAVAPAIESRSWQFSLFWAAVVVGVAIVASATINPLFGRFVHWDWMAGVAPVGFISLALAFRRRWV